MVYVILMIVSGEALNSPVMYQLPVIMTRADCEQAKGRVESYRRSDVPSIPYLLPNYPKEQLHFDWFCVELKETTE